jgi:Dolichyl-phosphate-mannose-protein mannosyltransferase
MNTPVVSDPAVATGSFSPLPSPKAERLTYALLIIVIVVFSLIRYRLREMPLERDEGEYAYAGQLLLEGVPPYQLAYNMKLPGTYVAYALTMALFGQSASGIHWGMLCVNALSTLLLFLIARRFFAPAASLIAATTYAVVSTSPAVLGLEAHATHFVMLFAISGLLLLIVALDSGRRGCLFGAGLLLGISFLMKQPGIFFPIFGAGYLLAHEWRVVSNWRGPLYRLATYTAGAILPFAITCLVLYGAGVFPKFWFWTFSYARVYASSVNLHDGLNYFRENAIRVVRPAMAVWLIVFLGFIAPLWDSAARRYAWFTHGFLFFSFLAVCPSLYFRPHYFILLLPAAALLTASAASCASRRLAKLGHTATRLALPTALILLALLGSVLAERNFLFFLDPVSACRSIYPKEPFVELVDVAKYIHSQTAANEGMEVLGADPQTYFYAQRRSVSGYMYIYPLTENQPYAARMQQDLISSLETAKPKFIVWVYDWDIPSGPGQALLAWMGSYLRANYSPVEVVLAPASGARLSDPGSHPTPMIALFRRKA